MLHQVSTTALTVSKLVLEKFWTTALQLPGFFSSRFALALLLLWPFQAIKATTFPPLLSVLTHAKGNCDVFVPVHVAAKAPLN
jgi:hypothetical protein